MRAIEDKLRQSYQNDEANFKIFRDQIAKLNDNIKKQVSEREAQEEKKETDVRSMEANFSLQLNIEKQSRKEFEVEFNKEFEEKVSSLRTDMVADRKERDVKISNMLSNISDELSLIQGELFAERRSREETYDGIIKKLGADVLRINDLLNRESKVTFF